MHADRKRLAPENGLPAEVEGGRGSLASPIAAIVLALALLGALAPIPARAAASVQLTLSVAPTVAGPGWAEVVWTITVTPSGGTVTGLGVSLDFYPGGSRMHLQSCVPACYITTGSGAAVWSGISDFSTPIQLQATGSYDGYGDVTGTASVITENSCPDCAKSATLKGPAGTLAVQATPATPLTGTLVHVTVTASMNVTMDFGFSSRLPDGLADPINVSPPGTWVTSTRQTEWYFTDRVSATVSYDTQVLAPAGSPLTIQDWLTGEAGVAADATVTIAVGQTATPKPAPTPVPTPASTPTSPGRPSTPGPPPTPADEEASPAEPTITPSIAPSPQDSESFSTAPTVTESTDPASPAPDPGTDPSRPPGGPLDLRLVLIATGAGGTAAGLYGGVVLFRRRFRLL